MSILIYALFLLLPLVSGAATINVPADQGSIQAAENAANAGDTIVVADGTYNETINVDASNITIKAANRRSAIIDCQDTRNFGFHVMPGSDNVVIDGFEIKNCKDTGVYFDGGSNDFNGWTIRYNLIHDIFERGIYLRGTGHEVHHNEIYFVGPAQESMGILNWAYTTSIHDNQVYAVSKNCIRNFRRDNDIYNNILYQCFVGIASNRADGGGQIFNNLIYQVSDGYKPKHNKCESGRNNAYEWFYHNTVIYNSHGTVDVGTNDPPTSCVSVKNNMLVTTTDVSKGYVSGVSIKVREDKTTNFELDGNFYDLGGTGIYADNPNDTVADFDTLAELQANRPYEANGVSGDAKLGDYKTGTKYAPGSPAFNGSLNLPTTYGTQLGAHGLTQTTPKVEIVKTVKAINGSSKTGQLGRLTDGKNDTRWTPLTNTGWVILELNNGQQVTFDTFWYWNRVKSRNTIESFIIQTGDASGGPWTTIHTSTAADTDTLGGWAWRYFPGKVTTRYVRYQWNSTHRDDGATFDQFQVSNFVDQDTGTPPPPPPTAVAYGPNAEGCVSTQQTGTTSLVIVPDTVTEPELAVETNTDATILIRAGTYSANDFNVQDDNIVLPYNCDSVIINMLGTETNNWTRSGWTVAGLQIDCSEVSGASCVNMIGNNNTIRNNEFRDGDTALAITGTTSGNTIQGNIFDGVGGSNGLDNLIKFSGSITSTDFKENWIRLDPTNNTAGNNAVSVDGVNGGSGFKIIDNLFTDANMIEHYIELENNTVAIEVSHNTFIGPFGGTGADGEASYAMELGDGPVGSDCYPNCPSHSIHHNYCHDSHMTETPSVGGKMAACWRVSTTKSWAGTIEFNIDNNAQAGADWHEPSSYFSGVTERHNTRYKGAIELNNEACTRSITGAPALLEFDNNAFVGTWLQDDCDPATDWIVTDNVRSNVLGGDFNSANLDTGNSTDTITLADTSDTTPDFTILGGTHSQKAALPTPVVSSAQVGNNCVMTVSMTPFNNGTYDHGPMSSVDGSLVSVIYSGSADPTITSSSIATNTLSFELSSCPLSTDTVTFDATHGWCRDSANVGSLKAELAEDVSMPALLRSRCLAVTGQSVTNNVTAGGATTFYVDNSCGTDGDGTSATCGVNGPWNTLESALVTNACAGMSAGDILDVSGGTTYYETENLTPATACSGIVVQNTSGENVVYDGTADISGETWNAIGGGVYETTYDFGEDEYPFTAWYDIGAGETRLNLVQTNQTCDMTLAAGFMRYNPTTNAICAHLSDGSSPAAATYFRIPQKESAFALGQASASNMTFRVNPGGGSFTIQRFVERGVVFFSDNNPGTSIDGLTFDYFLDAAISSGNIGLASATIQNNTISNVGLFGIDTRGDTGAGTIKDNTITDIQTEPLFEQCVGVGDGCHGTKTEDGAGIRILNRNGAGLSVTGNTILRVGGGMSGRAAGIWLRRWTKNNTVDGNYISHASGLTDAGYGILLTGENPNEFHDNNLIVNNRIYDVDTCYSQDYSIGFDNQDSLSNTFIHNTCVDPVKYGMLAEGDDSHTGVLTIKNNIFAAYNTTPIFLYVRTNDTGWNSFSYNAIECDSCNTHQDVISYRCGLTMELAADCTSGIDCLADWNASTLGDLSNNLEGDTNVSTTGEDPALTIDNASIAYDAGVGGQGVSTDYAGTSRPQGTEVDIGAHESADAQLSVDLDQHAFRFYNRFGQAGIDPLAAENVVPSRSIYERSEWNMRFAVIGQDGTDANLATLSPAYQHCNPTCGSWTALTTSCTGTAACLHDNPDRSDGQTITSDIALDGRIFHTGSSYYDTSTQITDILIGGLRQVELEYSLKMGDQMDEGDVVLFRVQYTSGSALEAYTETPSITVGPGRGTIRVNRHSTIIETVEE